MFNLTIKGPTTKRNFKVIDSFSEMSTARFCEFMAAEQKLRQQENKRKEALDRLNAVEELSKEESGLLNLDDILLELQEQDSLVRLSRIDLLASLCKSEKAANYFVNTKGVTDYVIHEPLTRALKSLADLETWVLSLKPVNKFKLADTKNKSILDLFRAKTFEVFDMDRQTVLRDAAAQRVASKLDDLVRQFANDRWENLTTFIAYVCRPTNEVYEISAQRRNKAKSFFGGKEVSSLSTEDRLEAYNNLLRETVEHRKEVFKKLPLRITMGVYKQYFFLSRS